MTEHELDQLIKAAQARFDALSPEEQERHREEQRRSWVRGEMALSKMVKKHVNEKGEIVYEDYASDCLD